MVHIYALRAALRVPIRSYYPPQLLPELSSDAYSKIVYGRNVPTKLKPTITVMWTKRLVPRNIWYFVPNHIVCLSKTESGQTEAIILDKVDGISMC